MKIALNRDVDVERLTSSVMLGVDEGLLVNVLGRLFMPSPLNPRQPTPKLVMDVLSGTRKDRVGRDPFGDPTPKQVELIEGLIRRNRLSSFCFAAPIKNYDLIHRRSPDLLEASALKLLYEKGRALQALGIVLDHVMVMEDLTGSLIYRHEGVEPQFIECYCEDLINLNQIMAEAYGARFVTILRESDVLNLHGYPGRSGFCKDLQDMSEGFYALGQAMLRGETIDLALYRQPTYDFYGFTRESVLHYVHRLETNQELPDPVRVICDFFLCAMLRHKYGFPEFLEGIDLKLAFSANPRMAGHPSASNTVVCRSNWFCSRHRENNLPFWAGVSVCTQGGEDGGYVIDARPLRLIPPCSVVNLRLSSSKGTSCAIKPYFQHS